MNSQGFAFSEYGMILRVCWLVKGFLRTMQFAVDIDFFKYEFICNRAILHPSEHWWLKADLITTLE